jgi:hypothetical protein
VGKSAGTSICKLMPGDAIVNVGSHVAIRGCRGVQMSVSQRLLVPILEGVAA